MNKLIKNQQSKIEHLQSKCIVYQNDNSDLKKEIAKLQEEHEKYFGKYGVRFCWNRQDGTPLLV